MNTQQSQFKALVEALLPTDLFQYFEITDVKITEKEIRVSLDELNNPPASHKNVISSDTFLGLSFRNFVRACSQSIKL